MNAHVPSPLTAGKATNGAANILDATLPEGHGFVLVSFDSTGRYEIVTNAKRARAARYAEAARKELLKL